MAEHTPQKGDPDYVDYVVQLAKGGIIRKGIINEPRVIFDEFTIDPNGVPTEGSPGVFINGEQFPIRLTHMLMSTTYLNDPEQGDPVPDNPLNIQRIGLRMVFHDQFYMNRAFLPVPVWGNKVVAASDTVSFATSAWDFVQNGQPFVLSARDTIEVDVQLNDFADPDQAVPVNVVFSGIGALSKRPYLLNAEVQLTDLSVETMQPSDFRNDGSEPIVITDMTVNVGAEFGAADPQGDIRRVRLNVRQVGNGTNATWFVGPTNPLAVDRMQADLCGLTTGRAVVHELPGDGFLWEPGEGLTVAGQRIVEQQVGPAPPPPPAPAFVSRLTVALAGYIM
ncbi:MAG: hypothetical protein ACYS5V_11160, partial [Planctomycetota bacterium]